MHKKHLIYMLLDPRTNQVRYIGKSSSWLRRPQQHGRLASLLNADGSFKSCAHLYNWIRSIRSSGSDYDIEVVEEFTPTIDVRDRLNDSERFWIAYFRCIGADLLNLTDGGDGGAFPGERNPFYGKKHSPEAIERNRLAHLGKKTRGTTGMKLSETTRERMRGPRPQTSGDNHPMFRKKHSTEARRKISEKGRSRKVSVETRAKQSTARKAYWERKRIENV